jgi:hypothetical protein
MGLGRPKNQSSQNRFKMGVCIGLVITNPTKLEWDQTNTVCEIYHDLFVLPNMQNFADCTVRIVLMWKLTVQSIRSYSEVASLLTGQ